MEMLQTHVELLLLILAKQNVCFHYRKRKGRSCTRASWVVGADMLNIKTWIMARGRPAVKDLTKPCVFPRTTVRAWMGFLNFTLKCSTTFQLLRKILNTQKSQGICNYPILTKHFRRKAGHRGLSEVRAEGLAELGCGIVLILLRENRNYHPNQNQLSKFYLLCTGLSLRSGI